MTKCLLLAVDALLSSRGLAAWVAAHTLGRTMNSIRCAALGGLLALAAAAHADSLEARLIMGIYPGVELGQTEAADVLDRYLPLADYLSAKPASRWSCSPSN